MSRVDKNYGINQTGGTINAGAIAVGKNAKATSVSSESLVNARAEMLRLVELLEVHANEVPDETVALGELAQRELESDQPNKRKVLGWLKTIATGAGSVAAISEAADTVRQAIEAFT